MLYNQLVTNATPIYTATIPSYPNTVFTVDKNSRDVPTTITLSNTQSYTAFVNPREEKTVTFG